MLDGVLEIVAKILKIVASVPLQICTDLFSAIPEKIFDKLSRSTAMLLLVLLVTLSGLVFLSGLKAMGYL